MTDDFLRRADAIFDEALDLAPAERPAFVARVRDEALRAIVEWLLRAHEHAEGAEGFLAEPALSLAAPLMRDDPLVAARPERVGPYRVLRELGRGGMGTVYLGERDDGEGFRQRVALKLVRGAFAADWLVSRFLAERRILASLEHPHIARLYDGGTAPDGTPWFAMEYVEGEPLDRWCQALDLPLATRLRLFRDVCGAVQYAHEQGVVHRDLKPSNILVTAGGDAKLLDFGIAKLLDPAADGAAPRTHTGMQLMTPAYAAPEQLRGAPATVASDIYALGVILYELVAGERPYRVEGLTPGEIERVVCDTAPARPSAAARRTDPRARVDADLDTIILTAMHKEPARRYASPARLLEDLERYEEGRPIRARPDTAGYRARKFLGRHRGATVAAAILLVLVPLSALAIAKLRAVDAPQFPTLLATGALRERDRLIVADFADRAGDSLLAAAVTEAVRIDLGQSPLVRVLTPRQVRVTLERMERPVDVALDDTLAREVAAREGVKAIVTGAVTRAGSAYTVAIQLVGAERGEALAAVRETASDTSRVIAAIDRASKRLRERVGESLRDLRDMPPLEDAATGSLAALRLYTQGQRHVYGGDRTNAIRFLERAVALDTAFGSAHLAISNVYASISETGRAEAAMRRALAHEDRLPMRERAFVLASRSHRAGDLDSAAATYERVLRRYPHEVRALNNLALIRRDQRRYVEAESLFASAAVVDSSIANFYFGMHSTQILRGRFDESRRTLDLIARRFPGHPILGTVRIHDASAQHDWALAERRAKEKIAEAGHDTLQAVDAWEALAQVVMAQGRLAEAERHWRTHRALAAASGSHGRLLYGAVQHGHLALRHRGDTARALAIVDSALRRFPLDSVLPGDRPYDDLARFYAAAGRVARAGELLAGADANDRTLGRTLASDRAWTRGAIALAERRPAQALAELRLAADTHACETCPLPVLARAYEAAGNAPAAADAYERYLRTPWFWRYEPDAVELGWAIRRLGELRAARGDSAGAAEARARLERLWRNADPELQRLVTSG